jgi:hypothetical protein
MSVGARQTEYVRYRELVTTLGSRPVVRQPGGADHASDAGPRPILGAASASVTGIAMYTRESPLLSARDGIVQSDAAYSHVPLGTATPKRQLAMHTEGRLTKSLTSASAPASSCPRWRPTTRIPAQLPMIPR